MKVSGVSVGEAPGEHDLPGRRVARIGVGDVAQHAVDQRGGRRRLGAGEGDAQRAPAIDDRREGRAAELEIVAAHREQRAGGVEPEHVLRERAAIALQREARAGVETGTAVERIELGVRDRHVEIEPRGGLLEGSGRVAEVDELRGVVHRQDGDRDIGRCGAGERRLEQRGFHAGGVRTRHMDLQLLAAPAIEIADLDRVRAGRQRHGAGALGRPLRVVIVDHEDAVDIERGAVVRGGEERVAAGARGMNRAGVADAEIVGVAAELLPQRGNVEVVRKALDAALGRDARHRGERRRVVAIEELVVQQLPGLIAERCFAVEIPCRREGQRAVRVQRHAAVRNRNRVADGDRGSVDWEHRERSVGITVIAEHVDCAGRILPDGPAVVGCRGRVVDRRDRDGDRSGVAVRAVVIAGAEREAVRSIEVAVRGVEIRPLGIHRDGAVLRAAVIAHQRVDQLGIVRVGRDGRAGDRGVFVAAGGSVLRDRRLIWLRRVGEHDRDHHRRRRRLLVSVPSGRRPWPRASSWRSPARNPSPSLSVTI